MITRKLQQMKSGQVFITLPVQAVRMLGWEKQDKIKLSFDRNKIVLEKEK